MTVEYVVLRVSGRSNIITHRCETFQEAEQAATAMTERSNFATEYEACSLVHGEVMKGGKMPDNRKTRYVTPIEPDVMRETGRILGLAEVFPIANVIERDGSCTLDYPDYFYTWVRMS